MCKFTHHVQNFDFILRGLFVSFCYPLSCFKLNLYKAMLYLLLFLVYFLRQGFSVALECVLELTLQTRLASNSQRSACLCLPSAGIKGMRHHRLSCVTFLKGFTNVFFPLFSFFLSRPVQTVFSPWISALMKCKRRDKVLVMLKGMWLRRRLPGHLGQSAQNRDSLPGK